MDGNGLVLLRAFVKSGSVLEFRWSHIPPRRPVEILNFATLIFSLFELWNLE